MALALRRFPPVVIDSLHPLPTDVVADPVRLQAVRETGLLDSAVDESFDRLTRLAAKLTGAPVTFISLVDETRDFYQSCFGFPEPLASDRQLTGTTFCHYALVSDGPLVIPDTLAHPIYRTVPTVQTLGVRAYLGVPLVTDGQPIGSFCAIDFEPHDWTALQVEVMVELAASTLREIELRRAVRVAETERLRLNVLLEENQRLYEEGRAATRAQDEFLATVTHELRTPMTAILGWSKLLNNEKLENETASEAAEAIASSARLQAQLVDDLLDASRIASGKIALNFSRIDVNDAVSQAVRAAQPVAESAGIKLHTVLAPVPLIEGETARLRQVMGNLIHNALKFSARGGLVEVTSAVEGNRIVITVSDTGRGISPELLPYIFERHRQARSAEQGGLGLGLAIARHLVELHGGEISAESDGAGKGARFIVRL